jgi:hypothetical protein
MAWWCQVYNHAIFLYTNRHLRETTPPGVKIFLVSSDSAHTPTSPHATLVI